MSASEDQTPFNSQVRGAGTSFGPNDTISSENATPGTSAGSATAAGHGSHPTGDNLDTRNVDMPNSRIGPQQEDLDGAQMCASGEGEVMRAQQNKQGQGEEPSFTANLDRKKSEQQSARDEIKEARSGGVNVGGGAAGRDNEGLGSV